MSDDRGPSLQERFAPRNHCFGCGAANAQGLRIRSFASEGDRETLVADWRAARHHEAFDGVVNGGIVGALLDCHSNWAATWHLMCRDGLEAPPCTVTSELNLKLRRPTPSGSPLHLRAKASRSDGPRVTVEADLTADGRVTATCIGVFVAVEPGHPAYFRW